MLSLVEHEKMFNNLEAATRLVFVCSNKKTKIGFQDSLLLNVGRKYCRMLQGEHSAILSTFMKLPLAIKILFCLFLSGPLNKTGLTVLPLKDQAVMWLNILHEFAGCFAPTPSSLFW